MVDPAALIAVARSLLLPGTEPLSDARLRRAVSTAYYALFHAILRAGTQRFMGADATTNSAGYAVFYRGFNHGRMKTVCMSLASSASADTLRRQWGIRAVSQDMRDFASYFSALQEARIRADYDPAAVFLPSDAAELVTLAEAAIAVFTRTAPDEQANVLALMLVNSRS